MATSGVTTSTLTARDLISTALSEISVIPAGDEPAAEELVHGIRALNGMLKSFAARGSLWRRGTARIDLDGGASTVVLPNYVVAVSAVRQVQGSGASTYERPLTAWEADDFAALPNKSAPGNPTLYSVDQQRDAPVMSIWPVPSTASVYAMDYFRGPEMVTEATQTVDVPQAWHETVWTNLAIRLSGAYRDGDVSAELVQRAAALLRAMTDADRPSSYRLGTYA